ncbi:MAG: hypothetical protein DBY32_09480 [Phascolarctobacterium sp.]|nr:MAG: hypothetical protein DBY32_09480 [Phascolarctobacterium sp.]
MKKSLVLAMAMALGVTASAYAANPFSDVPAGHWAYDAVNKLAAEGVVDGYPDGTYGGDKLMTRYEMAQIVAKAMAKGANVDKLAAEFADELDSLGVRVANLEKKADNVKITGNIRASYRDGDSSPTYGKLRTRLFINGTVNEDWSYTARLQNEQNYMNEKGDDDDVKLNWAYVNGPIGGLDVTAGRQNLKLHTGNVIDNEFDAIKVAYGKEVKLTGFVGKADSDELKLDGDRAYIVDLSSKIGVVDAYVTYYNLDNSNTAAVGKYPSAFDGQEIWNVGVALPVVKDLKLSAEYMYGTADDDDGLDNSGYVAGLAYRGAKASKPGSWGVWANYYDLPALTYMKSTNNTQMGENAEGWQHDGSDGYEGFEVGANVALAKNIVAAVRYFDLEAREGSEDDQVLWSEVVFTF